MKIRIKFSKHGNVKYIGHLDLQRYFQKAMRRAQIPISYSQGYSPHQIMSFAAPLGVGLESDGEYMDIEVDSFSSESDIVDRLNRVSCDGIHVLSAKILPDNAGNAMASVSAASYYVSFKEDRIPSFSWEEKISEFMEQDEIPYTKETKKSTIVRNLKDGIYKMECRDHKIYLLLDASSGGNVKPLAVIQTFVEHYNQTLQDNALWITREDTFTNIGTVDTPHFVPLDAVCINNKDVNKE